MQMTLVQTKEGISIQTINGEIPLQVTNDSYFNINRKLNSGIHTIGGYPARFIPELPRWALRKYTSEEDVVLDPFCGSGTTLVEARLLKRNALGIDHNPVARLLTTVKSNPLDSFELNNSTRVLNEKNNKEIPNYGEHEIVYVPNRELWFDKPVSRALTFLINNIESIDDSSSKDFFKACLCDTINLVSNVGSGQILQARRIKFNNKKNLTEKHVLIKFNETVSDYKKKLKEFTSKSSKANFSKIVGTDARKISSLNEIDAIITSPPYINAIDYIWAYKLKLHWLGLIKSDKERLDLSSQEIGTERIRRGVYPNKEEIVSGLMENIKDIKEGNYYKATKYQNELRAEVTYKYFLDMREHLKQSYSILKNRGYYCLVIGDNSICKVKIPTSKYLCEIAKSIGFKKILQFQICLKNRSLNVPRNLSWADVIKYDRMIVFQK